MDFRDALHRSTSYLRSLLKNKFFWGGLAALLLVGFFFYILLNFLLLPAYTRHDVSIRVPNVTNMPMDEAQQLLVERDLDVELMQRYDAARPRNVVLDQTPLPNSPVKPNRRIYLTVNTGKVPMVKIPEVVGSSLREAQNRLAALGLKAADARPDTIPHPFANTVTRQEPAAGDSLAEGSGVTLWYSTGLGDQYVSVPDVTDMTADEAQELLLEKKLRSVVVGMEDHEGLGEPTIVRQSRKPGTRVREGFEIRLFVEEPEDQPDVIAPPDTSQG